VTTDLSYFQYIVPCGLVRPVTSMAAQGVAASRENVIDRLVFHFGSVFDYEMAPAAIAVAGESRFRAQDENAACLTETGEFIYD
jgi:lipoate-protein ligase B